MPFNTQAANNMNFGFQGIQPYQAQAYNQFLTAPTESQQASNALFGTAGMDLGNQLPPPDAGGSFGGFGGVGVMDGLNFGLGALQTGLGMRYQNKALDQSQQALDLNRNKFQDMTEQRANLQAANRERADAAKIKISAFGNRG